MYVGCVRGWEVVPLSILMCYLRVHRGRRRKCGDRPGYKYRVAFCGHEVSSYILSHRTMASYLIKTVNCIFARMSRMAAILAWQEGVRWHPVSTVCTLSTMVLSLSRQERRN